MKSQICQMLGVEFPLFAFSHCRDVVAAVSRAGGFGVLGATAHSPESLRQELKWLVDHAAGQPFGDGVLIPADLTPASEQDCTYTRLTTRQPVPHTTSAIDLM